MVAMEVPRVTNKTLSKLNQQQHLLLEELERTKHRLREEIRAREAGIEPRHDDGLDKNASTASRSPTRQLKRSLKNNRDGNCSHSPHKEPVSWSPTVRCKNKLSSPIDGTRQAQDSGLSLRDVSDACGGGYGLKRSRSEAGIGSGSDNGANAPVAQSNRRPEQLDANNRRPAVATRISMLPVMSSTGDAALEVGLTAIPTDGGWTGRTTEEEVAQEPIHMLPIFRLPVVSKAPPNGFIRRIPREETQRERECRVREEEEMAKMKVALGLTDKQLAALEEELLPKYSRLLRERNNGWCMLASESVGDDFDNIELEPDTYEFLVKTRPVSKHERSAFSITETGKLPGGNTARGKRQRQFAERANDDKDIIDKKHYGRCNCRHGRGGSAWNAAHASDKNGRNNARDDETLVDRPTPRVLRQGAHSAFGAELGWTHSNGAFAGGGRGSGVEACGQGSTSGSILGTTASTKQLVAAAADVGMMNILELRRELGRSVGQVRYLAQAVKADVQEVTRICPVQHPRAVHFLRRWACERLATLIDEILLSRGAAALERWRKATLMMAMSERKNAYFRYQGSRLITFALDKAYLRRLAKGWVRWTELVQAGRAADRRTLEISASITMQTGYRGLAARRRRAKLAITAADQRRQDAAVAITRCVKGKVARMRYARLKADLERVRALEMLRRVGRGMLGRRRARRLREQRAKLKVAISLQRLFRGREGRRIFLAYRKATRERIAATKLQSITRGKRGRGKARSMRRRLREDSATGKIQRLARLWLARRLVGRRRVENERVRKIRTAAALNIQRVYRGHRSRVLHNARLEIKRSLLHKEDAAATKIQALVRAHLSKRVVSKMARKRRNERTEDARAWTETWSEDAQAWFYYNAQTGEALWEPPRTGYTKHDGKLVLASGEVIEDPLAALTEEERSEARKQSACVECEDKRATRKCEQCGDGYCTSCFRKTHASGRRAKHTWKHVGPMECAECEAEVAIKWCTACDDPFCGPCWANIHSRGKRSKHSHCTISPAGRVSSKATAPDGADAGAFTPGDSLRAETTGAEGGGTEGWGAQGGAYSGGAALVGAASYVSEWQEYSDDNGTPYWYNSVTGASQYENPNLPQGTWAGGSITTASSLGNGGAGDWGGEQAWNMTQQDSTYSDPYAGGALVPVDGSSAEWSEHYDDGGNIYYYNSVTAESQYESPY